MASATANVLRSMLLAACLLAALLFNPTAAMAAGPGGLAERIVGRDVALAFPPLDDPVVRSVAAADHMRPDDVVAGLVLSGAARAYPWWILKNHHAVNDRFQDVPVLIAFCEQCSAATAFRRDLDDRVLSMETEGVCGGTIILRDRETGTLWAPFDGHGLEGPLTGRELSRLPVFLTTWQDWSTRHPKTDVIYQPESERSGHGSREHPGKWGIVGQMGETLSTWDTRLAENAFVFGIQQGSGIQQDRVSRAYPLRTVRERGGAVNDTLDGQPVVVLARGAFEMVAYDRRLAGVPLTFEPTTASEATAGGPGHFRDVETGSVWTIEGLAAAGPHQGKRLEPADGYMVEWHVWSEYHPESEIFGHSPYRPPTGFKLPIHSLPRLTGERVADDSLRLDADTNLIMVWARWCPPCRDKLPLMRRLAAQQKERGYRFVSIAVQLPDLDELGALQGFLYQNEVNWPVYLFDDARYVELDEHYRAQGGRGLVIPTLFVTDRSGTVLHVLEGQEIDAIDEVLADRSPR